MATILSNAVVTLFSAGMYFDFRRKGKAAFQSGNKISAKNLMMLLLGFAGISLCLLVMFVWLELYTSDPLLSQRSETFSSMNPAIRLALTCVIAPVAEEFMFRLFLYNLLKSESNWIVSMVVLSTIFAALHGTLSHMVTGVLFGVFMTLIYERTKVWYASILCHILYNTITNVVSTSVLVWAALCPPIIIIITIFTVSVIVLQVIIVSDNMPHAKEGGH